MLQSGDMKVYSDNKNIRFDSRIIGKSWYVKLLKKLVYRLSTLADRNIAYEPVFSERIVEYPLLFQYLDNDVKTILDLGCCEDLLPIHLASLGYKVTGFDIRLYPFSHSNFEFIQADILSYPDPGRTWDCIVSVSTIEHVGLGGYGGPIRNDGDKIAVKKLFTWLNPGGKLIITVPFGRAARERNMRIYDYPELHELVPSIETERFFFKPSRRAGWIETNFGEINNLEYEDYYANAPCQAVAFVVSTKE